MPEVDTKKLLLEVDASVEGLKSDLRSAGVDLDRFERKVDDRLDSVDRRFEKTNKGVTGIGKSLDNVQKKVGKFAGGLKTAISAFIVAGGINLLSDLVKQGLEYAQSIKAAATEAGVGTTALQEYRIAALDTGVAVSVIDDGLKELTRRLGEAADGGKRQIELFDGLGISIRDANGQVRNAADIIPEIADALKDIETPAERATRLVALFGENGQKLDALLTRGSSGINNLRDAAHELGIVLSEDQIKNSDKTARKFEKLKLVLQAKLAGVVSDNSEAIGRLADALAKLAENAVQALDRYLRFREALNKRDNFVDAANRHIDRRTDLTSAQKEQARRNARRDADRHAGTASEDFLGGLFTIVRPSAESSRPGPRQFAPTLADGSIDFRGYGGRGLDGQFSLAGEAGQANIRTFRTVVDTLSKPAEEAARELNEWSVQLDQLNADLAIANAEVTGSLTERAAAERQRINADLSGEILRIKADEDLTKAQRDQLIAVQEKLASARKELVNQRLAEDLVDQKREAEEELLRQKLDQLDDDRRTLEAEASIARDRQTRLGLERRILAAIQEEERLSTERKIASGELTDAVTAHANLERRQAAERAQLERDNLSPGAAYLDDLSKSAGRLNDDLERVAVGGLQSLNDGIAEAIVRGDSLGKVFSRVTDQIIADLLRIAIQQAIVRPLAESLFGGALSGTGGGGFFGSIFGREGGGPVSRGKPYIVGEKGRPELFVPSVNGRIFNQAQLAAAGRGSNGNMSLSVNINAPGATAETVAMIRREITAAAPAIADAARSATMRDLSRPKL